MTIEFKGPFALISIQHKIDLEQSGFVNLEYFLQALHSILYGSLCAPDASAITNIEKLSNDTGLLTVHTVVDMDHQTAETIQKLWELFGESTVEFISSDGKSKLS